MKIVFPLALKEVVRSPGLFLLYLFMICIGLVGPGLVWVFRSTLQDGISSRASEILGADLTISKNLAFTEKEKELIEQLLKDKVLARTEQIHLFTMTSDLDQNTTLAHLIVLDQIPLKGHLKSSTEQLDQSAFTGFDGVWVSKDFTLKFSDLPSELKIGDRHFAVQKVIEEDTTASFQIAGMAPRIYIHREQLASTKLLSMGSTSQHLFFFNLFEKNEEKLKELRFSLLKALDNPSVQVRLPDDSSEQLGRAASVVGDYLSLVSLVALFLSGIGIVYVTLAIIQKKMVTFAILKTLGFTPAKLLSWMGIQLLIPTLGGALISYGVVRLFSPLGHSWLQAMMPADWKVVADTKLFFILLGLACLVSSCASLPLLSHYFRKKSAELLNKKLDQQKWPWSLGLSSLIFLPLSMWAARSIKIGGMFFLSVVICLVVLVLFLHMMLKLFEATLGKAERFKGVLLPLLLRMLARYRARLVASFLAIGVGMSLLVALIQFQTLLSRELQGGQHRPAFFFFDIQEDQLERFTMFFQENKLPLEYVSAMIRGRLISINGAKFERSIKDGAETREAEFERSMRNRGVNLSFRPQLGPAETVIEGPAWNEELWRKIPQALSVEKRYAARLKIKMGDRLLFDVAGVEVEGVVANFRSVKWTSFLPNFFLIFAPGTLEEAPKTYLGTLPHDANWKQKNVMKSFRELFPNVSVVDIKEMGSKMERLFQTMKMAAMVMASITLAVGLMVMWSLFYHQQKAYAVERAYLSFLGMTPKQLILLSVGQLFVLLVSSGVMGIFLGEFLAYMVNYFVLELQWHWSLAGPFTLLALLLLVGPLFFFIGLYFVPEEKPLALLNDAI